MITISPIRTFLTQLTEKSQEILEQTATTFWAEQQLNTVCLTALKKNQDSTSSYQTDLKLVFETATEQQEFISACLAANIKPTMLIYCTGVKPSAHAKGATIELTLNELFDVESLKRHSAALLPEGWVLEEIIGKTATLRYTEEQDLAAQKELLKREMPSVLAKFRLQYPLPALLFANHDPEFPGENVRFPPGEAVENDLGIHFRTFVLGTTLQEEVYLPCLDSTESLALATPQELEDWLRDPAAQKDKIIQKCHSVFARVARKTWEDKSFNALKFGQLREAAQDDPVMDEILHETTQIRV